MDHPGRQFPSDFQLILASQSPRRHSLLRDLGVPFTVVTSRAEEVLAGDEAAALAQLNAVAKATWAELPPGLWPGTFVLGTDTLVTIDGRVMGKPGSAGEAADMVAALAGRTHQVVSGVALARTSGAGSEVSLGEVRTGVSTTDVTFLPLMHADIQAYLDSGEWRGKAGGYAVQGIAALFVSKVGGEYSNVVGLPLCLLAHLFRQSGFDLLQKRWLSLIDV